MEYYQIPGANLETEDGAILFRHGLKAEEGLLCRQLVDVSQAGDDPRTRGEVGWSQSG